MPGHNSLESQLDLLERDSLVRLIAVTIREGKKKKINSRSQFKLLALTEML